MATKKKAAQVAVEEPIKEEAPVAVQAEAVSEEQTTEQSLDKKQEEPVEAETSEDDEVVQQNEDVGVQAALHDSEFIVTNQGVYKQKLVPFCPENFPDDFDDFGNPKVSIG